MRGVIILVSDDKVKEAAVYLSEELGLPVINNVGNGVLPILNAEAGKSIIESLIQRINENLILILVIGKGTWAIIESLVPQVDLARLLMRFQVRDVAR